MKVNVYVVRDKKLERNNLPLYARNDSEASIILIRSGVPKSIYEDIDLLRIGEFDDESLIPLSLCEPVSVVKPPFPAVGEFNG